MARASTGRGSGRRGAGSRIGRSLKVLLGALLVLLILVVLNAFALNNETGKAELTVPGAQLVGTTSGQLQVLDTGQPPVTRENLLPPKAAGPIPYVGLIADQSAYRGMPIVLIHGSAGAINWWDDLVPLLKPYHRVIAIDLLGYGGSDKPDSDYSIETQASLVAQVLAKLEVPPAVLVGHSLGGKVVTSVAEQSPDLATGLVLVDTAPDGSFGGLSGSAKAVRTPLLGQALWRIAPDFMIRRNVAQGFAPGYDVPDKYVDDVRDMTYPAYKESAVQSDEYTDDRPLDDRLAELGMPLLVIFGAEDQIADAREAISAYAAVPDSKTLLIPGSGHSPQIEAPKQTAEAIESFTWGLAKRQAAEQERARAAARAKRRASQAKRQATRKQAKAKTEAKRKPKARAKSKPKPRAN